MCPKCLLNISLCRSRIVLFENNTTIFKLNMIYLQNKFMLHCTIQFMLFQGQRLIRKYRLSVLVLKIKVAHEKSRKTLFKGVLDFVL